MSRFHRLIAVVLFAVLLLAVMHFTGLRGHLSLAYLHQRFVDNMFTGVLIYMALFVLGNLVQVPGWIFLAAAVLALGQAWGALVTYLAAVMSCLVTFLLVRQLGGDALRGWGGPRAARLLAQLDTHPVRSVALLRVLAQTLPALNYALALSGVKFRYYLVGTLVGLPLPIVLYTVFFDSIASVLHLPHY